MTGLRRLWRGEVPLSDAFWTWAVLGGLAVNMPTSALFLWLMTLDQPGLAFLAGYAISLPYNLIATVGVWRAAERHPGDRVWAEAARIVTLSGMIVLSVT
jgi:hypothetical protein